MATVVVVEQQEYEALVQRLAVDRNVVLVSAQALKAAGVDVELAQAVAQDYDCGGEADVWLELVSAPEHYFLAECERAAEARS